ILHAAFGLVDPFLDLGRRHIEGPTGLGNRRFSLNDFRDQRRFSLRRPAFYFFFHDHAHVMSFQYYHLSRNSLGHYTEAATDSCSEAERAAYQEPNSSVYSTSQVISIYPPRNIPSTEYIVWRLEYGWL